LESYRAPLCLLLGHHACMSQPSHPPLSARAFDHQPWTVGAEEEFMLVDGSGRLADAADELIASCERPLVSAELSNCMVETGTPVCESVGELERELAAARQLLGERAERLGCAIMSSGMHPTDTEQLPLTAGERYEMLAERYPWVVHNTPIYGLHVHVGVEGAERAIALHNQMRLWLGHLLAMSVNSPFQGGVDTGLASTRSLISRLYPRSGLPPHLDSFEDYQRAMHTISQAPANADFSQLWWAMRPHGTYGTLELRVFDAQTDVRRSAALAALTQALCVHLDRQSPPPYSRTQATLVAGENLWTASRYGLDGELIDPLTLQVMDARESMRALLDKLQAVMEELGSEEYLPLLALMCECSGADHQREIARAGGMRSLIDQLMAQSVPVSLATRR
jgi:carboxylate-amine ligase